MPSEFHLHWSSPTAQNTSAGVRIVRTAIPTEDFWTAWRNAKEGLQAKGFSVRKSDTDGWQVLHWSAPSAAPPEESKIAILEPLRPLTYPRGLLTYQPPAVQAHVRALRTHGASLDASDAGIGKTFVALATLRELGLSALVVATKSILTPWQRAADAMGVKLVGVTNWEKVRTGNTPFGRWKQLPSGAQVFEWAKNIPMLVFDEVHRGAGIGTDNSAMLIAAKIQKIPTLMMSATSADSPARMRAIGFVLGLHGLKDFPEWMMAHGCYLDDREKWQFAGSTDDLLQIHRAIFPSRGFRIRIAELGDQFPATKINAQLVDVVNPNAIEKAYQTLREAIQKVRDKEANDSDKAAHLTAQLRARQITELAKVPAVIEMTKDEIEQGRSVLIGANFTDTVKTLAGSFGSIKVVTLTGEESSPKKRQAAIDAFAEDKARVFIMNEGITSGVGCHDQRGQFPRTSLLMPGFNPVNVVQFFGRVHRATGRSKSLQRALFAAGCPTEERKAERLTERLRGMSILNDGVDIPITENDLMGLF